MSLRKKAIEGMKWVILTTITIRIITFVTKIILARILAPSDFGLISIGTLVIDSIGIFREIGLSEALVYKKDDSNYTAANSMFFIISITSVVLFLIAYLIAPFVAVFFENPTVEPIVRILSITIIIQSLGTVPAILLEKELEFKKKMLPETLNKGSYAVVAISFALLGHGIWSLVYGHIFSSVIMVALIWVVSDWRPTFKFNKKVALELFDYGKYIFASGILVFAITNIDYMVVGKIHGAEALGFYTIAYTISNLPSSQITHLVGKVTFPMYSKIQDDLTKLGLTYLNTLKYVSILSFPMALGILVVSNEFVSLILGDKWLPAVIPLQIMCVLGLIESIVSTCIPILKATGNPKIFRDITFFRFIFIAVIIYPLTSAYDISGTALAITIPALLTALIQFYRTKEIIKQSTYSLLHPLVWPFVNSVIMALAVLCLKSHVDTISYFKLGILILSGVTIYVFLTLFTDKEIKEKIAKLEIKELHENNAL